MKYDLEKAHLASYENESLMHTSEMCGCFNCKRIFNVSEITKYDWCQDKNAKTATCPYCSIDSVISDNAGFEITPEFA